MICWPLLSWGFAASCLVEASPFKVQGTAKHTHTVAEVLVYEVPSVLLRVWVSEGDVKSSRDCHPDVCGPC
jgi:hypothetical protein